jgi:hypothetical protein
MVSCRGLHTRATAVRTPVPRATTSLRCCSLALPCDAVASRCRASLAALCVSVSRPSCRVFRLQVRAGVVQLERTPALRVGAWSFGCRAAALAGAVPCRAAWRSTIVPGHHCALTRVLDTLTFILAVDPHHLLILNPLAIGPDARRRHCALSSRVPCGGKGIHEPQ